MMICDHLWDNEANGAPISCDFHMLLMCYFHVMKLMVAFLMRFLHAPDVPLLCHLNTHRHAHAHTHIHTYIHTQIGGTRHAKNICRQLSIPNKGGQTQYQPHYSIPATPLNTSHTTSPRQQLYFTQLDHNFISINQTTTSSLSIRQQLHRNQSDNNFISINQTTTSSQSIRQQLHFNQLDNIFISINQTTSSFDPTRSHLHHRPCFASKAISNFLERTFTLKY